MAVALVKQTPWETAQKVNTSSFNGRVVVKPSSEDKLNLKTPRRTRTMNMNVIWCYAVVVLVQRTRKRQSPSSPPCYSPTMGAELRLYTQ